MFKKVFPTFFCFCLFFLIFFLVFSFGNIFHVIPLTLSTFFLFENENFLLNERLAKVNGVVKILKGPQREDFRTYVQKKRNLPFVMK